MKFANVRIGCSGWNYKSWRGPFYARELTPSRWLAYYSRHFDTVELNGSFYRLPTYEMFSRWRDQTPEHFVMAIKASRFLTHLKRLREPVEPLVRLFDSACGLGDRLGPVLYQLPSNFRQDLERLESFLELLPTSRELNARSLCHVFEFRHNSWYVPDTFRLLDRFGVGLCWHDKLGSEISAPCTGALVYVRFHGPTGLYRGSYDTVALARWARTLAPYARAKQPVYAYFNNDADAVATKNALALCQELELAL